MRWCTFGENTYKLRFYDRLLCSMFFFFSILSFSQSPKFVATFTSFLSLFTFFSRPVPSFLVNISVLTLVVTVLLLFLYSFLTSSIRNQLSSIRSLFSHSCLISLPVFLHSFSPSIFFSPEVPEFTAYLHSSSFINLSFFFSRLLLFFLAISSSLPLCLGQIFITFP